MRVSESAEQWISIDAKEWSSTTRQKHWMFEGEEKDWKWERVKTSGNQWQQHTEFSRHSGLLTLQGCQNNKPISAPLPVQTDRRNRRHTWGNIASQVNEKTQIRTGISQKEVISELDRIGLEDWNNKIPEEAMPEA